MDLKALAFGQVRRLVGSESASLLGDFMVLAAMPFAVLALGGSGQQIAVVLAAQGAGVALTLPIGGVLGDRFQRRQVMVAADMLRFFSQAAIAAALLSGHAAFWQLIVAQAVHGVGTGVFMPASASIVPDAVPGSAVQATNALKVVARSVAGIGGPALGGLAVLVGGPGLAMSVDAATFLLSAGLLTGLSCTSQSTAGASISSQMRDGWRAFRGRRWLRSITLEFTLVNAIVLAPFYVCAPSLSERFFGGANAWAVILCALAAGELFGAAAAMFWRPARPLVAGTLVFACWVIPLVLLAAAAPLALVVGGMAVAGAGQAVFAVLWETTIQGHVPSSQRSRLSSFEQFGSLALVPFGFVLGGWMEQSIGADRGLFVAATFLLFSSMVVLALPCVWKIRSSAARNGGRPARLYRLRRGDSLLRTEGKAA